MARTFVSIIGFLVLFDGARGDGPAKTLAAPPMGWMSWERFRCEVDCEKSPRDCISEDLYLTSADALVNTGLRDAGYVHVSIDDCWSTMQRDDAGRLVADPGRFQHGMAWLSGEVHSRGLLFGLYGDVGLLTCEKYPGSWGHERTDAETFRDWGVDYLKLDGCNMPRGADYAAGYVKWGEELRRLAQAGGPNIRPIAFSCSWPAYLGEDETQKKVGRTTTSKCSAEESAYECMHRAAGCNSWRNYGDIDNKWNTLHAIILHLAKYDSVVFSLTCFSGVCQGGCVRMDSWLIVSCLTRWYPRWSCCNRVLCVA